MMERTGEGSIGTEGHLQTLAGEDAHSSRDSARRSDSGGKIGVRLSGRSAFAQCKNHDPSS